MCLASGSRGEKGAAKGVLLKEFDDKILVAFWSLFLTLLSLLASLCAELSLAGFLRGLVREGGCF